MLQVLKLTKQTISIHLFVRSISAIVTTHYVTEKKLRQSSRSCARAYRLFVWAPISIFSFDRCIALAFDLFVWNPVFFAGSSHFFDADTIGVNHMSDKFYHYIIENIL